MKAIKVILICALIAAICTAVYVLYKEETKGQGLPEPAIEQTIENPEQEPPDAPEI